jgi:hypothetical protein
MSTSGGRILSEQAYAQGKMLDHGNWKLARGITPSDVDFVVESGGCFLFAEFSRGCGSFDCLSKGQRMMYARLASRRSDIVVVCQHSVPSDRAIDTLADVEAATVYFDGGEGSVLVDNSQWQLIVEHWAESPARVLGALREVAAPPPHACGEAVVVQAATNGVSHVRAYAACSQGTFEWVGSGSSINDS